MNTVNVQQLLDIGISLSSERDGDSLLEHILTFAMQITNCDGGTIYIRTGNSLLFKLMITQSQDVRRGGRFGAIYLPPVALTRSNVCACAALDNVLINVPDAYASDGKFDFSGPKQYDQMTGYRTSSMLVVPMVDDTGTSIGVLQLINAQNSKGELIPFDYDCEMVIRSLTSQAGICLTNMNYAQSVRELMNSFVRVMSTAIDARTPYNANHTYNMVRYAENFIEWLDTQQHSWKFSIRDKRQFLLSVWLHDVGKLVIPLEVMDKDTRLGALLPGVLERLRTIALLNRLALAEGRLDPYSFEQRRQYIELVRGVIVKVNTGGPLTDEEYEPISAMSKLTYEDENGQVLPWLTEQEIACLSIRRGTLTTQERKVMESHVSMTEKMLYEMKFPTEYADVPTWASQHHECLNGTGYPHGLTAEKLSRESRLLSILDIFEALTARDRPYTPPKPMETVLAIIEKMVGQGKLDGEIYELFKQSHAWEGRK